MSISNQSQEGRGARPRATKKTPQQIWEEEFLKQKLAGFRLEDSRGWKWLQARFGKIAKEELLSLGQVIAHTLNLELTREYKRRKETMIVWFDENYDTVMPFIKERIHVIGRDKREIIVEDKDPLASDR